MYALNTEHLRAFFPRLEEVAARLQRRWERAAATGERVDVQRDLMRFTVDVTSGIALGTDLNTLEQEGDVIQRHLDKVFPALARRVFAPFPYWRWFKLPAGFPMLRVRYIPVDADDAPILIGMTIARSDRFLFEVNLPQKGNS